MKIKLTLRRIVAVVEKSYPLQARLPLRPLTRTARQFLISAITLFCFIPAADVRAAVVNYSYDALGRVTKAVYSGDMSATITYEYDETGNWTSVTSTRAMP